MTNKYSLTQLVAYFLKLGAVGFGGPIALIGYMHRDLVEDRKWINNNDYKDGLALAQLAPGPLAAQLSIYIGYVDYKIIGATLTGLAFILPSFIMVLILGLLYVHFNGLAWMQYVFYGVGPAVIGIICISSFKLSKKTIGKEKLLWALFFTLLIVTFISKAENIWLILLSGFIVWMVKHPPRFKKGLSFFIFQPVILQVYNSLSNDEKILKIGWFFFKAGAFVFGSGLAIIPFLYGGLVKETQWLTEQQFLDAVAVAMITPGPVVITVGFIGYLIAGFPGACIAALATFLPCYIFTVIAAPYFKKHGQRPGLKSFVEGVTTSAVGAIAGAVLVLGFRQLIDKTSAIITIITILILLRYKIPEPILIFIAAILGIIIKTT